MKLEGFAFIPINAFCAAVTTFVSQNIGAQQFDRVKKGATFGIGFSCLCAAVVGVIFFAFAPAFIRMFGKAPEAVAAGADLLAGLYAAGPVPRDRRRLPGRRLFQGAHVYHAGSLVHPAGGLHRDGAASFP